MTGTDLLSHLQFLGRHFLDERRVGWAFARHQGRANGDVVDVLRIVYAGPTRSGMTLQQVVGLLLHVLTGRSTMDEELAVLDDYTSDVTPELDFVFRRRLCKR